MKKLLSTLLLVTMLLAMCVPFAGAAGAYEGKTVLLYTGNVRGNAGVYSQIAVVKANYEKEGANVVLMDAGNYLQGKAIANTDRGLSIYNLMDLVGYSAAAMGKYEFVYGDATTGYPYHGNFTKYYTQAELFNGAKELTYAQNAKGDVTATRAAKDPASFAVVCSNAVISAESYYAAEMEATISTPAMSFGVVALSDLEGARSITQDGHMTTVGNSEKPPVLPKDCDITVCLANVKTDLKADIVIQIESDGALTVGAYVIDNKTKEIKSETVKLEKTDANVDKVIANLQKAASPVVGVSEVTLDGRDSTNWNGETNLGDLTTDALKWYAENKFTGFKKDVPVVAIQNGGNCDQFLYTGEVTKLDLLRALPFSPMGVGILYVTGAQLLETLEAASQKADCAGFAQVAGLKYTVSTYKDFYEGEEYGKFHKVEKVNRVEILNVGGKAFNAKATYAVVADNFLMNGNDTYYIFKELRESEGNTYLSNGNSVKTRDVVELYIKEVLKGKIGSTYAKAGDRITIISEEPFINPFVDVHETDWFFESVRFSYMSGLIKGMTENTFEPNTNVSRAMMVTLLYRMEGSPDASAYANPFTDVEKDAWYTDAICWAFSNKIVNGMGDDLFAPDDTLTREQAAAILYRYAELKKYDLTSTADFSVFPDAGKLNPWATKEMTWAVGAELINGVASEDGYSYLDPQGSATRAQMATILMRFSKKFEAK